MRVRAGTLRIAQTIYFILIRCACRVVITTFPLLGIADLVAVLPEKLRGVSFAPRGFSTH
jgi:hypothetical protein